MRVKFYAKTVEMADQESYKRPLGTSMSQLVDSDVRGCPLLHEKLQRCTEMGLSRVEVSYYPLHGNTEPNAVFALNFPGLALKSEPYALFA